LVDVLLDDGPVIGRFPGFEVGSEGALVGSAVGTGADVEGGTVADVGWGHVERFPTPKTLEHHYDFVHFRNHNIKSFES
jgi:hypothetical protein